MRTQENSILYFFLLAVCALIVLGFNATSFAEDWKSDVIDDCDPMFVEIDKVLVTQEHKLPFEGIDWSATLNFAEATAKKNLNYAEIPLTNIDAFPTNEKKLEEGVLYAKIVFSYAAKESFTIPPADNQFLMWIEYSKRTRESDGKLVTLRRITVPEAYIWDTPPTINSVSVLVNTMPNKPLFDMSCDVLHFSKALRCTNRTFPVDNKIVKMEKPCVKETRH